MWAGSKRKQETFPKMKIFFLLDVMPCTPAKIYRCFEERDTVTSVHFYKNTTRRHKTVCSIVTYDRKTKLR